MTALERIKHLEKVKKSGDWPIEHYDGVFLLKAFCVMREIAQTVLNEMVEGYNLKFNDIDQEFEQRMKDQETNV